MTHLLLELSATSHPIVTRGDIDDLLEERAGDCRVPLWVDEDSGTMMVIRDQDAGAIGFDINSTGTVDVGYWPNGEDWEVLESYNFGSEKQHPRAFQIEPGELVFDLRAVSLESRWVTTPGDTEPQIQSHTYILKPGSTASLYNTHNPDRQIRVRINLHEEIEVSYICEEPLITVGRLTAWRATA